MTDPNPHVAGRGLRRLLDNGHEVRLAQDATPFEEVLKIFLTNHLSKRPFVTLKWAESEDGFMGKLIVGYPIL